MTKVLKTLFALGGKLVPKFLRKAANSDKPKKRGHSFYTALWTGALLGGGAALLLVGAATTLVAAGAVIAPGLLGTALTHGAVGIAASTVGLFALRAGEHELGFSFLLKAKDFIGKIFGHKKEEPKPAAQPEKEMEIKVVPFPKAAKEAPKTIRKSFSAAAKANTNDNAPKRAPKKSPDDRPQSGLYF